jgi:hypothetical protein
LRFERPGPGFLAAARAETGFWDCLKDGALTGDELGELVDCEEPRVWAPFDQLLSAVGDLCPAWFAGVDFLAILDMALSVKSKVYYVSFVSRLDEVCD